MKTTLAFLIACLCAVARSQTGGNKASVGSDTLSDGKVVVQQLCNSGAPTNEASALKKEIKQLREALLQTLDEKFSKDPWIKVNTAPVCFGARDDQFGKFLVPSSGKLAAVKLAHVYGYVTCDKNKAYHWSYWGCGKHSSLTNHVDTTITTSDGKVLLPSSQFSTDVTSKWSLIPGYNSLSPELVLSVFSNPPNVTGGQELRLWYGEDLANSSEGDNGGKSCCDIYARLILNISD